MFDANGNEENCVLAAENDVIHINERSEPNQSPPPTPLPPAEGEGLRLRGKFYAILRFGFIFKKEKYDMFINTNVTRECVKYSTRTSSGNKISSIFQYGTLSKIIVGPISLPIQGCILVKNTQP